MKPVFKWGVAIIVVAAVVGMTIWSNEPVSSSKDKTNPSSTGSVTERPVGATPNSQAPDLTLTDLSGKQVQVSALKGKKLVVNFWASWCPPCKAEMPGVVKTAQKYQGKVEFYGVNLTSSDSEEHARQFVSTYGVTFPTLLDPNGEAASRYRVFSIPTTITINENGIIIDRVEGPLSESGLEEKIQKLIVSSS